MQYRKEAQMDSLHDAEKLLLEHGKEAILHHSRAVADVAMELAGRYALDAEVLRVAGLCHDIGGIMSASSMLSQAQRRGIVLDPAEMAHPFLLHQQFSRILCEETLHIADERILSAVQCHTTLWANASEYDMALYIADKIAWDQPGEPPYGAVVAAALERSLAAGCLAAMDYMFAHDMILMPHRWLLEARCQLAGASMAQ